MKRYALVSLRGTTAEQIAAYLPANYEKIGYAPHDPKGNTGYPNDPTAFGPCVVIAGRDSAGWTLDGYVIPRLQSGLHVVREIGLEHPAMKQILEEWPYVIELHNEDNELVAYVGTPGVGREDALERASACIEELRAEYDDDNLMPALVYRDGRPDPAEALPGPHRFV